MMDGTAGGAADRRTKSTGRIAAGILAAVLTLPIPTTALATNDAPLIASLGDSYSSGEGNPPFYGQGKGQEDNEDWLAHRSQASWPGRLQWPSSKAPDRFTLSERRATASDAEDGSWIFKAVSGAKSSDIDSGQFVQVQRLSLEPEWKRLSPQIDELAASPRQADLVTLTLGGNDVGFADIVTTAITNPAVLGCHAVEDAVDDARWAFYHEHEDGPGAPVSSVRDGLSYAYDRIDEAAGGTHIVVAGYPILFEDGAHLPITAGETRAINEGTADLNGYIEELVKEEQAEHDIDFVPVAGSFVGGGIGSSAPLVRRVTYIPQSQDTNWFKIGSSYSVHPNAKGVERYAQVMQRWIDADYKARSEAEAEAQQQEEAAAAQAGVDRLREFEERHDATLAAAEADPRLGGNMQEMRAASAEHYRNSEALATEIGEWLVNEMGADPAEVLSMRDRRETEWQQACAEIEERYQGGHLIPLEQSAEHGRLADALICDFLAAGYARAGGERPAVVTFDEAIAAARSAYREAYGRDPSCESICYAQASPRRYRVYAHDDSNEVDHDITVYPDGRVHDDAADAWLVG